MANYDPGRVSAFVEKLQQLDNHLLVLVWIQLCKWADADDLHLTERYEKLVRDFHEMPPWDQQSVLYQLTPIIHHIAGNAAAKVAKRARTEDPL